MKHLVCIATCLFTTALFSQYKFEGYIDNEKWQNTVYLSIVEDYRTISGISEEQIIAMVTTDSTGHFVFSGNQLESENRIYKLHVDNCEGSAQLTNHFDGHCSESRDIVFIAKNTDIISFPLSYDEQMFCEINSTNPKTNTLIQIDSLKEIMKFSYGEYRSEANRKLNNRKWFRTLHTFSKDLNEPLAELYAYSYLSDRSNNLHSYYLEDLDSSNYYDELLERLKDVYPNSNYTKQYSAELSSDRYLTSELDTSSNFKWWYILLGLLVISIVLNMFLLNSIRNLKANFKTNSRNQLTNQEQNILDLIIQGKTNKEIAEALFVSVSTVKTHINNIYKKLNVQSRDEIKSLINK